MLVLLWLMYILLCVRIRVQLEAELKEGRGSAMLSVCVLGMQLSREFEIVRGKTLFSLRLAPRYGKRRRKAHSSSAFFARLMKDYVIRTLRSGRFERIAIHLRMGLGDACQTAVAAGAAQALICALLASAGYGQACELRIVPEFSGTCLHARLQGIFSCQVGDIILAALKTARRNRKEGLKWTSIPLRA